MSSLDAKKTKHADAIDDNLPAGSLYFHDGKSMWGSLETIEAMVKILEDNEPRFYSYIISPISDFRRYPSGAPVSGDIGKYLVNCRFITDNNNIKEYKRRFQTAMFECFNMAVNQTGGTT